MTYRSLLVFLDDSAACDARVQCAIRMARERECHLVGLAPTGLIDLPPEPGTWLGDYAARAWDTLRDRTEQTAQRFRDACHAAGLSAAQAVIDEADRTRSLVRHAQYHDLVVLSQAWPDARSASHEPTRTLVEDVVLHSARPTLILPHAGTFEHPGSNVLVAWDDSREAARALADALPLLRHASQLQVVCWREPDDGSEPARRASVEAIQRWLTCHGIASKAYVETCEQGLSHAIRLRAAEMHADLVVMGAYGHARWMQRVLGGATRGMLEAMNVPVLMSH
ncbi:MAG TPA: universal stress protein [Burkholderiaceae bacterium]